MKNEQFNVLFIQTDQWSERFTGYGGCRSIMTPHH